MTLVLHRHTIKPGHVDAWRELWPDVVHRYAAGGYVSHRAFLETHAEPKLTWLYSAPDGAPLAGPEQDAELAELHEQLAPHVFRNLLVRPVVPEVLTDDVTGRLAIMRRYSIVGDWDDFLAVWREIVTVRERYGFGCLFAVADRERDMFTWAFDTASTWDDFPAAQREYYHDPARVRLRGVFDFMADYSITPAEQLHLPGAGEASHRRV